MIDFILKYWVEWCMGIVAAILGILWRKSTSQTKKFMKEQDALKDGMKAILHNAIMDKCKTHLSNGYITPDDLDEIEYLNEPYRALGGNGTAKTIIEKVKNLPMK